MGRPLLLDVWERPVTSVIVAACSVIWCALNRRGLGYDEVGVSYHKAVVERQYWRCLTASFSHVSGVHLLFNMSSLWSLGVVEQMGYRGDGWGSGWYVRYTLVMLVGTMVLVLAAYHALARWAKIERYERVTAVGYSCVVFGWMTVLSVKRPTHALSLLGFINLPVNLAPFGSLVFTSVIVPRASFVGHLAGILMGYLVAWGCFQWMNWYWTGVLAFWVIVGFFSSLKATTDVHLPFIRVLGSAGAGGDAFSGTGTRLGGGVDRSRLLGAGDDAIARALRGTDENV
jgi:membrane associated rhomboid family serine protease